MFLTSGKDEDEATFHIQQKQFLNGTFQLDRATGLMIYVPDFVQVLARVKIPVLAIFGEKDRNVNWRKTVALYSKTIGKNPKASLTIRTFPDGNHNLQQARTGGLRETLEMHEHRLSPTLRQKKAIGWATRPNLFISFRDECIRTPKNPLD